MDKVVSYNEFLKHKDNLDAYLKELFDKIPELNVYFPISLSSDERHLIYTKSKGYLFEKLHKIGSKYSIKLWKPGENGVNSVTEENDENYVTGEENEEKYVTDDEEDTDEEDTDEVKYDFKDHLCEISNVLEKQHDMMFSELQKCRRGINRLECIFTTAMIFNFVSSILFITQSLDVMLPLPRLNTINDF